MKEKIALKAIFSFCKKYAFPLAMGIGTIVGGVMDQKRDDEFEEMKKDVSELKKNMESH